MAENRLTQEAAEVAGAGTANARSSQEAIEVLEAKPQLSAGLTQLAVEVLYPTPSFGRLPLLGAG